MNSILFDIGGTKTRVAYSVDGQSFEEPTVFETVKNYEEGIRVFIENIKKVANEREIKNIVGGIAGPFDENKRTLVGSPNLKDWISKPFKQTLEKELNTKVYIENDSAMVGLGEANFGAGKNHRIVAYITISTGVGGARIIEEKLDEKSIGF